MIREATAEQFDISVERGFLPVEDPSRDFPWRSSGRPATDSHIFEITDCARELPHWHAAGCARREIRQRMESFSLSTDIVRACHDLAWFMRAFSFLGNAWVWGGVGEGHTDYIPAFLAKPFVAVAEVAGRPPILSYESYSPQNWCRFDPEKLIELGNIGVIQNFFGGCDENGFILGHVEIDARGAPIPVCALGLVKAAVNDNPADATHCFGGIIRSLDGMNATLKRMPELCDPYIYFKRVRPFIHGWKSNPALPDGVRYEGCFKGESQWFYRGETGAQNALFPTLYALLGVRFTDDVYLQYLHEMRKYMPPRHRGFIMFLEEAEQSGFSVVSLAKKYKAERRVLFDQVQETLALMIEFLKTHIGYASSYIQKQAQKDAANPTAVGTGGTPFMKYLAEHIDRLEEMQNSL